MFKRIRALMEDAVVSRLRNARLRRLVLRFPGSRKKDLIKLVDVYQKLDDDLSRFRSHTDLACIPGCGQCCESPKVETTVFEMFPIALHLWETGEADAVLKDLEMYETGVGSPCRMYRPTEGQPGKGRCSVYTYRPLLCRLFGYTSRKRKDGVLEFITCKPLKEKCCDAYQGACQKVKSHPDWAVQTEPFARRVQALATQDPKSYPINEALQKALHYVGMQRQYSGSVCKN